MRRRGRSRRLFIAGLSTVLGVVGLVSCAISGGVHRLYHGPSLPIESVAILRSIGGGQTKSQLCLLAIDGKMGPGGAHWGYCSADNQSFTIELLPGMHTLTFRYYSYNSSYRTTSVNDVVVAFTAKPGKMYTAASWPPKVEEEGPIPQGFRRPP